MSADAKSRADAGKSEESAGTQNSGVQKTHGKAEAQPKAERVVWVTFHDKSDHNQTDDVILSVQGETIVIKRGEKIPILERYRVAAENATYPKFTQLPNQPRKQVGTIRVYPFDTHGEATMNDWNSYRMDGTAKARAQAEVASIKA